MNPEILLYLKCVIYVRIKIGFEMTHFIFRKEEKHLPNFKLKIVYLFLK